MKIIIRAISIVIVLCLSVVLAPAAFAESTYFDQTAVVYGIEKPTAGATPSTISDAWLPKDEYGIIVIEKVKWEQRELESDGFTPMSTEKFEAGYTYRCIVKLRLTSLLFRYGSVQDNGYAKFTGEGQIFGEPCDSVTCYVYVKTQTLDLVSRNVTLKSADTSEYEYVDPQYPEYTYAPIDASGIEYVYATVGEAIDKTITLNFSGYSSSGIGSENTLATFGLKSLGNNTYFRIYGTPTKAGTAVGGLVFFKGEIVYTQYFYIVISDTARKVSSAEIIVDAPAAGGSQSTPTVSASDATLDTVSSACGWEPGWYSGVGNSKVKMASGERFEAGKSYTLIVKLVAADGCVIDIDAIEKNIVCAGSDSCSILGYATDCTNCTFVVRFTAKDVSKTVNSIAVTGISAPVACEKPDISAELPLDSGYTVKEVLWIGVNGEGVVGSAFPSDMKTARVLVYILPKDGYVLSKTATGTINGSSVSVATDYYSTDGMLYLWKDYDVSQKTQKVAGISYSPSSATAATGDAIKLTAVPEFDTSKASDLKIQWYKATGNYYGSGTAVKGATNLTYTFTAEKAGTSWYYCEISATVAGGDVTTVSDSAPMVKVTVSESAAAPVITAQPTGVDANAGDTVSFTVAASGSELHYQWYQEYSGASVKVGGDSQTYTIKNVNTGDHNGRDYYCVITNKGGSVTSGKARLKVSEKSYVFPFTDVKESDWYYKYVKGAHEMGLINGKSATIYAPGDNMTIAEAIKLAACMNQLYNDGAVTLTSGSDKWYSTYYDYCRKNNIVSKNYTDAQMNSNITREEYADMFSRALPAEALAVKNDIPDNSIPDVQLSGSSYYNAIYKLYRAGIICGNDPKGTFSPKSNILRSEVAAILIRMMDSSYRVNAPAELGK